MAGFKITDRGAESMLRVFFGVEDPQITFKICLFTGGQGSGDNPTLIEAYGNGYTRQAVDMNDWANSIASGTAVITCNNAITFGSGTNGAFVAAVPPAPNLLTIYGFAIIKGSNATQPTNNTTAIPAADLIMYENLTNAVLPNVGDILTLSSISINAGNGTIVSA